MKDVVNYAPPFGFLGKIANRLIIRKQLKAIFEFRSRKLEEIFGIYREENVLKFDNDSKNDNHGKDAKTRKKRLNFSPLRLSDLAVKEKTY